MFGKISEGVKALAQSIVDNPKNWRQEQYHFRCISSPDIAIWTANGVNFIAFKGNKGLSYKEKVHLNDAIKKCIALKVQDNSNE